MAGGFCGDGTASTWGNATEDIDIDVRSSEFLTTARATASNPTITRGSGTVFAAAAIALS